VHGTEADRAGDGSGAGGGGGAHPRPAGGERRRRRDRDRGGVVRAGRDRPGVDLGGLGALRGPGRPGGRAVRGLPGAPPRRRHAVGPVDHLAEHPGRRAARRHAGGVDGAVRGGRRVPVRTALDLGRLRGAGDPRRGLRDPPLRRSVHDVVRRHHLGSHGGDGFGGAVPGRGPVGAAGGAAAHRRAPGRDAATADEAGGQRRAPSCRGRAAGPGGRRAGGGHRRRHLAGAPQSAPGGRARVSASTCGAGGRARSRGAGTSAWACRRRGRR
jgi:hypothetical protein